MFEQLQRFVCAELESRNHPGSSVAVVKGGKTIWVWGFGYSNIEKRTRAAAETAYRCASVTKPVLATGFLQLMERGKFNLDDPVNRHLEEKIQTRFEKKPTIRDLLTHYSGMPTRVPPIYYDEREAPTLGEYVSKAARTVQPPGRSYAYCNTAFAIIGHLIELFSGKKYDEYVKENVLKPLDMDSSGFSLTKTIEGSLAQGYERNGNREDHARPVKPYILGTVPQDPAGSLFSTVADLSKFLIAHMNGGVHKGRRVLKANTVREMHKLQVSSGNSRSGMALSWFRNMHNGHVMLSHTGSVPGFTNHVAFYPDTKIGVCWLSNLNDGTAWRPPAPTALRIIAKESPLNPNAIQTVPEEWKKLVGTYGGVGQQATVTVENGYLILRGMDAELYLEKVGKMKYRVHGTHYDGYELTFEGDEKGNIHRLDIENQVIPRHVEEPLTINETADLTGSWRGEYVHPYGFFSLDLNIEGTTQATATDMEGTKQHLTDFKAEKGRITGTYRLAPPRDYAGWGAGELSVNLELAAVDDELRGRMMFSSRGGVSKLTISVVLKRV